MVVVGCGAGESENPKGVSPGQVSPFTLGKPSGSQPRSVCLLVFVPVSMPILVFLCFLTHTLIYCQVQLSVLVKYPLAPPSPRKRGLLIRSRVADQQGHLVWGAPGFSDLSLRLSVFSGFVSHCLTFHPEATDTPTPHSPPTVEALLTIKQHDAASGICNTCLSPWWVGCNLHLFQLCNHWSANSHKALLWPSYTS